MFDRLLSNDREAGAFYHVYERSEWPGMHPNIWLIGLLTVHWKETLGAEEQMPMTRFDGVRMLVDRELEGAF